MGTPEGEANDPSSPVETAPPEPEQPARWWIGTSLTASLIRLITGVQARWVGFDPDEFASPPPQRVFFANHTSNLDGPVIWAALPKSIRCVTRPVAARDYWLGGPTRRFLALRVFNCLLVERKKVTPSNNPLRLMEKAIEAGQSLIIFPAGTRSSEDDDDCARFKPGIWHLARKRPEAQFVPVYLENLSRILPKGEVLLIPLLATARFGKPLTIEPGEAKDVFLARAAAAVEALKNEGGSNA
jgi:1-acyl-sn-glycerol-3-phosphate acyltransferase